MYTDPIVEEVRAIREAYAAEFDFDLNAMGADLRNKQRESGREIVSAPAKHDVSEKPLATATA